MPKYVNNFLPNSVQRCVNSAEGLGTDARWNRAYSEKKMFGSNVVVPKYGEECARRIFECGQVGQCFAIGQIVGFNEWRHRVIKNFEMAEYVTSDTSTFSDESMKNVSSICAVVL